MPLTTTNPICLPSGTPQLSDLAFGSAEFPEWQRIASRERGRRDSNISRWEREHGLAFNLLDSTDTSTPKVRVKRILADTGLSEQLNITETLPSKLLAMIAQGRWTAEQVLKAFAARACLAHQLTNPLTAVFFGQGLVRAQELDRHYQATGEVVGPLHGLPISVKDVFYIKGMDSTYGLISRVGCPATSTETLIEKLHDAGAVFYCKTNVPQSLMSGECMNFIFGCTASAHNTELSAGGSSGGEGSLVALGGSPLGVGTDVAGSIRTPANFNGIYGLCPSFGRFPTYGPGHAPGLGPINSVSGPLSRSVDGLEVYTRNLLHLRPWEWDSSCVRLPWDQDVYEEYAPRSLGNAGATPPQQKLCFGIVATDSIMTPHAPIQRCLREVESLLISAGHSVIDLPNFFDASDSLWDLLTSYLKADGGIELHAELAKYREPLVPGTLQVGPEDALTAAELAVLAKRVRNLQQKYHDRWNTTEQRTPTGRPVDVLVLPSGVHTACQHGTMNYWLYEAISNILDWTCATIPVGVVDPALDSTDGRGVEALPHSEADAASLESCKIFSPLNASCCSLRLLANKELTVTLEAFRDAPVCLQVIGQRLTEEKVLGCLRTIDHALGRDAAFQA